MPGPHRKSPLLVALLIIVALAAALWFGLPAALSPLIRGKLQALVAGHLQAELRIGSLSYSFPYTIRAGDVQLISGIDHTELIATDSAQLSLVRLPLRSGPLLIEKVVLDRPRFNIIRNPDGTLASWRLLKPRPASPGRKPSDFFRLRLLAVRDGALRYEDRSGPAPAVMEWSSLQTDLRLSPRSASLYAWQLSAGDAPLADLRADGSIDIDQLVLDVQNLSLESRVSPGQSSGLPPQIGRLLASYAIQGQAKLDASLHLPFRDPASWNMSGGLQLDNARGQFGRSAATAGFTISFAKRSGDPTVVLSTRRAAATLGDASVDLTRADARIDTISRNWRVEQVLGMLRPGGAIGPGGAGKVHLNLAFATGIAAQITDYTFTARLDDVAFQPPGFAQPITGIFGVLSASAGRLVGQQITGRCRDDEFEVRRFTIPLSALPQRLAIDDIQADVRFHQPSAAYPGAVGRVLAAINPAGPCEVAGWMVLDRSTSPMGREWDFTITPGPGAAMAVTSKHLPLTDLAGRAVITRQLVRIEDLAGRVLDGAFTASVDIDPRQHPPAYQGELSLRDIDLRRLSKAFIVPEGKNTSLSGRGDGRFSFNGRGSARAAFAAEGEIQIVNGELWEIPLFDGLAKDTKIGREALTAGEAAAVVSIADEKVHLRRAALNSPALGLQGNGTVSFDGRLDLDVTAAPLGDWERDLKKTGIPVVSDVAGGVAGAVQKLLQAATSQLLYQFRVTGKTSAPRIQTVPAPVLSDAGAALFGQMLHRRGDRRLIDSLREAKE